MIRPEDPDVARWRMRRNRADPGFEARRMAGFRRWVKAGGVAIHELTLDELSRVNHRIQFDGASVRQAIFEVMMARPVEGVLS